MTTVRDTKAGRRLAGWSNPGMEPVFSPPGRPNTDGEHARSLLSTTQLLSYVTHWLSDRAAGTARSQRQTTVDTVATVVKE